MTQKGSKWKTLLAIPDYLRHLRRYDYPGLLGVIGASTLIVALGLSTLITIFIFGVSK